MPLSFVNQGETRKVISFHAEDKFRDRLLAMGICPGRTIKIIDITPAGMIIEVQNTRFALNKGLAQLIQVS
jgi:Fe2+ transport system protein FeoA